MCGSRKTRQGKAVKQDTIKATTAQEGHTHATHVAEVDYVFLLFLIVLPV